eukprot:4320407-Pyramimonas_sp.AAC.1
MRGEASTRSQGGGRGGEDLSLPSSLPECRNPARHAACRHAAAGLKAKGSRRIHQLPLTPGIYLDLDLALRLLRH